MTTTTSNNKSSAKDNNKEEEQQKQQEQQQQEQQQQQQKQRARNPYTTKVTPPVKLGGGLLAGTDFKTAASVLKAQTQTKATTPSKANETEDDSKVTIAIDDDEPEVEDWTRVETTEDNTPARRNLQEKFNGSPDDEPPAKQPSMTTDEQDLTQGLFSGLDDEEALAAV